MKRSIRLYGEFLCNFLFSDTFLGSAWWFQSFFLLLSFFHPLFCVIFDDSFVEEEKFVCWCCFASSSGHPSFVFQLHSLLLCLPELLCFVILLCRLSHFSYNFQTIQTQLFSSTHSSLIAPRSRMTWCVLCSIFMQTSPAEHERAEQNLAAALKKVEFEMRKVIICTSELFSSPSCSSNSLFFVLALFLALVSEKNVHEEFARIFRISYASQKKKNTQLCKTYYFVFSFNL